jgi:Zn-dependent M28 family amino/carboxypeptidase
MWIVQPFVYRSAVLEKQINVDPIKLEAHVDKLSNELYPRNYLNLQNLNSAADYIRDEFKKTGGTVSEQVFGVNGADYRNISLELGGNSEDRIVIGAHYDSANMTYGADDNASGVAGLIELAKAFAADPPKTRIEFVAYSLEEPPFFGTGQMGSFVHAESLKQAAVRVKLMVCLEMIGYFSDEPDSQNYPLSVGRLLYPDTGNFIAIVGNFSNALKVRGFKADMMNAGSLPVYSINAPAFVTGVDFSDHRNYWAAGYDAVMITDSAFYRNKDYHTVKDTYEKLDYKRMAEAVNATYAAVANLTN